MKKTLMILILALQFAGVVSIAGAGMPWPDCPPCRVNVAGE